LEPKKYNFTVTPAAEAGAEEAKNQKSAFEALMDSIIISKKHATFSINYKLIHQNRFILSANFF
jgi:hypothetical protein